MRSVKRETIVPHQDWTPGMLLSAGIVGLPLTTYSLRWCCPLYHRLGSHCGTRQWPGKQHYEKINNGRSTESVQWYILVEDTDDVNTSLCAPTASVSSFAFIFWQNYTQHYIPLSYPIHCWGIVTKRPGSDQRLHSNLHRCGLAMVFIIGRVAYHVKWCNKPVSILLPSLPRGLEWPQFVSLWVLVCPWQRQMSPVAGRTTCAGVLSPEQ